MSSYVEMWRYCRRKAIIPLERNTEVLMLLGGYTPDLVCMSDYSQTENYNSG